MQQWLRLHGELGTKLQQRQVCGDRAAKVRASLERFTAALHEALHDDHLPAEHLAEIAQQRVSEAREAAAERRRYEQEMAEQTETLTTLDQQLHDIDQQRQQSADRWQKLLGELDKGESFVLVENSDSTAVSEATLGKFFQQLGGGSEMAAQDSEDGVEIHSLGDLSALRKEQLAEIERYNQRVLQNAYQERIEYFKDLAEEIGIPYQTLINLYLRDCATSSRRLAMEWKRQN